MAFLYICPLKEHCHEIFRALFFCLKHSIWAPYEQAKAFSRLFCFSRRYALAKFKIGMTMRTRWTSTQTHIFCEFLRENEILPNLLSLLIWSLRRVFFTKKRLKARDTVPLTGVHVKESFLTFGRAGSSVQWRSCISVSKGAGNTSIPLTRLI